MVGVLLWTEQPLWVIIVCVALMGVWAAVACVRFGGDAERAVGSKDAGCVVADEVAGMCIALAGLQWWNAAGTAGAAATESWWWHSGVQVAWAFVLFRIMDIVKPPPCRQIQEMRGGWGILMDDVLAGVYASVVVHLITFAG
jgi:phosphatidylglycerophosphatase A